MFLFEEGHLVDFSSTELIKLVRALFAESPNRARAIDTIRAGRPTAGSV
jgi:centromere/kinetochore protein ZW10